MKRKKKNSTKEMLILTIFILILIVVVTYLSVTVFFQYHFYKGTYINGYDCSYKSASGVCKMLEEDVRTYYLQLTERHDGIEHIRAEDIGLDIEITGDVSKLLKKQNSFMWFNDTPIEDSVEMSITYDQALLKTRLDTLNCLTKRKMLEPTEPVIEYVDGEFILSEMDPGTQVDDKILRSAIEDAIKNMESELVLEDTGCYLVYPSDNEKKYRKILKKLNDFINVKITLTFNNELPDIVIDKDIISKWVSPDEKNKEVIFDEEAVYAFVKDFSKEIETMGTERKFKNSYGKEITVSGGDYGWWISEDSEAESIIKDIKNKKNTTRELDYLQTAIVHGKDNDFGDTYIEVCLSKQKLFCYDKGKLITKCDIVSGNEWAPTPTGIYKIRYMAKDHYMNKPFHNGNVKYWMVFYGNTAATNIGLISCDWLDKFGGDVYKSKGTTGSILVPEKSSDIIYEKIPNNIPVIIYN